MVAIGTYEFSWPQLAQSTQEERAREGYTPNDPLKRTGHLKASISHVSGREDGVATPYVGTNDPNGKYHEFGTTHVPPRPFLGPAMVQSEPEIEKIAQKMVAGAVSRESSESLEVLHIAKEAFGHVKEAVKDFVDLKKRRKDDERGSMLELPYSSGESPAQDPRILHLAPI